MKQYDIIVIGGGGGTKLISPPAAMGLKVAAIEKEALGGTCLNRGCIPSKMLIHPADVMHEITNAGHFDIAVPQQPTADFTKIVSFTSNTVDSTADSIAKSYRQKEHIDFYHGTGKFISDKIVEVEGHQLTADRIFIAVGARPFVPDIPGLSETPYWTSREALRAQKQPKKLLIIGGGYIGTELGHFYGEMGTEVEFIVRGNGMISQEDSDIVQEFTEIFTTRYTTHLKTETTAVRYENETFYVSIKGPDMETELSGDALLVATGIIPNTDTLALENTHITRNNKGFIDVNDRLETSVPGVYALGDCIGKYFFRHTVNFEGEYLFRTLYQNPSDEPITYPPIPHAIFTNPQIGGVGKTEDELKKVGIDYIVGKNPYKSSAMGDALRSEYGFVKLLFDKQSKKLLGAHIIGAEASDMIHMCIAFMTMDATLDDMLRMIYIHPALPENVRNAARDARKNFETS